MSDLIACPQCGFPHVIHLGMHDPTLVDVYACTVCFYEWDAYDECAADDGILDDDEGALAYAPPADNREHATDNTHARTGG